MVIKEKARMKKNNQNFYVVGIGASAGGLDAIQSLFDNIPDNTGMAFVIVQHLSPNFKSMMDELLSKHTKMPVQLAKNNIQLKPNNVYLNPKEKNIIYEKGRIKYVDKSPHHALNLPIDLFFNSLGNALEENSIGIILSGTGTDGSRGIATIKGAGGTVIVQKPETAEFDGMPVTAINSGNAEFIATPEEMSLILERITSNHFLKKSKKNINEDEEGFDNILEILYKHSGIDFKLYKNSTLLRRIEKRLTIHQLNNFSEYAALLSKDANERELLVRDCLIGVTRYFRDFEAFEALKKNVLPDLFTKGKNRTLPVRIWVTACSTGEEAYSIAIIIDDFIKKNNLNIDFKIFATDIDREAIQIASEGRYPVNYITDIPKGFLEVYFVKNGDSFEIVKRIREKIVFSQHNLLKDPPFIKVDMVSCRNLLIYLLPKVQYKVIGTFQFGLKKGGYLFLGHSETLGETQKMFKTIDSTWRIYQSIADYKELPSRLQTDFRLRNYENTHAAFGFNKSFSASKPNNEKFFTEIIAQSYGPASVFVDTNFDILYINGDINDYVEYRPGVIKNVLLDILVDEKLKAMIRNGVRRVKTNNKKVVFKEVPFVYKKRKNLVTISFQQHTLKELSEDIFLITFEKAKKENGKDDSVVYDQYKLDEFSKQRIEELENELKKVKQELQNSIEELETSNEELQASNEELQASNEELQSTNEELQSVNEELYTVNAEIQVKNKELMELTDDVTNIMDSTDIGILLLDLQLRIRKFTPALREHFSLTEQDLGRSIFEFASYFSELVREESISDAKKVLANGSILEKEFCDDKGHYFLRKTSPFLTKNNEIKGVVISFVNITKVRAAEMELIRQQKNINSIYNAAYTGIYVHNLKKDKIEFINQRYTEILGYSLDEINNMSLDTLFSLYHPDDQDKITKYKQKLSQLKRGDIKSIEYRVKTKYGKWIWCFSYDSGYEYDENDNLVSLVGSFFDVSELKRNKKALKEEKEKSESRANQFRNLFENMEQGFALHKIIFDEENNPVDYEYIRVNKAFEKQSGILAKNIMGKTVKQVLPAIEKEWIDKYSDVALTGKSITFHNYSAELDKHFNVTAYSPEKNYFATIFEDVTEQRKILADVESANKLNETLIESSPFGIILYNKDGDCILANEAATKLLGGTKKQILELNFHNNPSWKTGSIYENAQKTIKLGGKNTGVEQYKTYFGNQLWLEYFFVRMIYNDQPHLIFKFQDVSERIKAQLDLKESEARYKTLFSENKSVMLLINPDTGQIEDANHAALKYYGYSLPQIKKMNISQINILSDEEVKEEMKKARTDKKNFFQFKHKLANEKIRNVQVYSGKIFIDNKELLYSIIHDNTNQIKAEEKLKQQTVELIQSEKMTAMGTLIAGVAHELNNPLMGILNYTDYSLEQVSRDNNAYPVLLDLKEEAEKSAEIVKGLLTFSRKEKVDKNYVCKTNLIKAIESVVKLLSLKIKNKNINLLLPELNGDFLGNINLSYLQQVIFNILDNAIFAVANSDIKEIKIDLKKQAKYTIIQIADSGPGISFEDSKNIFDPFFTTKPVGEGTGLGLSICKNILNDVGGDVTFTTQKNKGTTFSIKIPVSNT